MSSPVQTQHFFQVAPDKLPVELQTHEHLLNTTQHGKMLAFAHGVLEDKGFFQKIHDLDGPPKPLLSYPFLDYMNALNLGSDDIVELGSGHSTLWFQSMFKQVESYETDTGWFSKLQPKLNHNTRLTLCSHEQLENADIDYRGQSWLMVDFAGKRTAFLHNFFQRFRETAKPNYIVLDNAEWYRNGARHLTELGYTELPFFGLCNGKTWVGCTSLFIGPGRPAPDLKLPLEHPHGSRNITNPWDEH